MFAFAWSLIIVWGFIEKIFYKKIITSKVCTITVVQFQFNYKCAFTLRYSTVDLNIDINIATETPITFVNVTIETLKNVKGRIGDSGKSDKTCLHTHKYTFVPSFFMVVN